MVFYMAMPRSFHVRQFLPRLGLINFPIHSPAVRTSGACKFNKTFNESDSVASVSSKLLVDPAQCVYRRLPLFFLLELLVD